MIHRTIRRGVLALAVVIAALFATVPLQAAGGNSYTLTPLVSDVPGAAPVIDPNLVNAWGLTALLDEPVLGRGQWDERLDPVQRCRGEAGAHRDRRHRQRADWNCLQHVGLRVQRHERDAVRLGEVHLRRPRTAFCAAEPAVDATNAPLQAWAIRAQSSRGSRSRTASFRQRLPPTTRSRSSTRTGTSSTASPNACRTATRRSESRRSTARLRHVREAGRGRRGGPVQAAGSWTSSTRPGTSSPRVAQHGQLNAPWGLALAPSSFGRFSNDLLVGNFGDGQINAYALGANGHYTHKGELRENNHQITIDGLWALEFGNGARRADEHALLHRGAERRVARPLREDNWVRGKLRAKSGRRRPDGLVSRFLTRFRASRQQRGRCDSHALASRCIRAGRARTQSRVRRIRHGGVHARLAGARRPVLPARGERRLRRRRTTR